MATSGPTTVLVVDHHRLFTECLGIVLTTRGYSFRSVELPAQPEGLDRVQAQLLAQPPDVALVNADLRCPGEGATLILALAAAHVPVAVLCDDNDQFRWGQFLAGGAQVVLPKSGSLGAMVTAVRRMGQGQHVLDREERTRLIALGRRHDLELRSIRQRLARLAPLEARTLRHLMAGRSVRDIATVRVVSEATVRSQVKAVLGKLEVSAQISAVALAIEAGWTAEEAGPKAG